VTIDSDIRITILVDNTASKSGLLTEHGLSLWIEYKEKRILFDTGQSNLLLKNAKKLGIDLIKTDAIVLSHGHYDHTGGLSAVLEIAPTLTVYAHPAAIQKRFSRKDLQVKPIGMPATAVKALKGHNVVWTERPLQICNGITVTGQTPRKNSFEDVEEAFFLDETCRIPDNLLDDQALFIESPKGLIVVFGCAHAGVVNTLDYVYQLSNQSKICAVIGGLHLVNASKDRMERTIEAFKKYDIEKIIPLHCTGLEAIECLRESFSDKCICYHNNPDICF